MKIRKSLSVANSQSLWFYEIPILTEARLAMIQNSQNRDLIESQALTICYTETLTTVSSPCLVTFFRIPIALFEIHSFLNLLVSLVFSCPLLDIMAMILLPLCLLSAICMCLKFALWAFLPASFKIPFSAAHKLQQPLYTYQHWFYSAVDNASFMSLPIAKAF